MKGGAAPTLGEGREGMRTRGVLDLMVRIRVRVS
jgi:hypothetical protein